jgi:hypothetical protein
MLSKEAEALNEQKAAMDFLAEMAVVVSKYRTELPLGPLMGALEVVKLRLWHDAHQDQEKGQS